MKHFTPFFWALWAFTLMATPCQAAIWRINNDDDSADFSALQQAVNSESVQAGDTLYIEGSALEYEGADISKQLFLIGPGYLLTNNPNTPANSAPAVINTNINLLPGSEGTIIKGLSFASSTSNIDVSVSNITVTRCNLSLARVTVIGSINNLVITQNLIRTIFIGSNDASTNMIITNNAFFAGLSIKDFAQVDVFENNVMQSSILAVSATFFRNNIMLNERDDIEVESANITHNISTNGVLGSENGNIVADIDSIFAGELSRTDDNAFRLSPNSPGKGAGFEGTDMGIFGGADPYVPSGLPNIPVVTDLRVPLEGDIPTGITIRVKAKAN